MKVLTSKVLNIKIEFMVVLTACRRHRALRTQPWIVVRLGWVRSNVMNSYRIFQQ